LSRGLTALFAGGWLRNFLALDGIMDRSAREMFIWMSELVFTLSARHSRNILNTVTYVNPVSKYFFIPPLDHQILDDKRILIHFLFHCMAGRGYRLRGPATCEKGV